MALLAKQAWRVLHNHGTHVARIFRRNNIHKETFLEANVGHKPSYSWSIWNFRSLLKK
jgi:hypothetical protein